MENSANYPAARCFHLQGGCRAIDSDKQLQLEPMASNGKTARLIAPGYHAGLGVLHKAGFSVLGVDFYSEQGQLDGRHLPDWRVCHIGGPSSWLCADQADKWSFISHSAFRDKNGLLWDVASRVSHQLRTCGWRLREVSEAYQRILFAKMQDQSFEHGRRFKDGFTWLGYLAVQSFLVDACVLRDYLAEYRALLLAQTGTFSFSSKVTQLASLKRLYLNECGDSAPAIDLSLSQISSPGGWLHELGKYRDLVVHCAPLAEAGKTLFAVGVSLALPDDVTLPSIKLPIPSNPAAIAKERTSGTYFEDPELSYARFTNALQDPMTSADGLDYEHGCLGRLAILAAELAGMSPVEPKMPTFTERDIMDLKIIRPDPFGSMPD